LHPAALPTGAYSRRVPTHDGCLLTTGAYSRRVPTHDRCVLTTAAYSRQVRTHDRCVLTTGAYSRQVRTHNGCVLATGVYSRQVCTRDRCVLATGVYLRQVCTRDSVDPSSLQASSVDSRQKVVPLIFEVAPLCKTVNASSVVLTTTRPTLLCTPAQAESAIEHVAGACSFSPCQACPLSVVHSTPVQNDSTRIQWISIVQCWSSCLSLEC